MVDSVIVSMSGYLVVNISLMLGQSCIFQILFQQPINFMLFSKVKSALNGSFCFIRQVFFLVVKFITVY